MTFRPKSRLWTLALMAWLLVASGSSSAERKASYWNSSTGAQITLVLNTEASEDRRWEITVKPWGQPAKNYVGRSLLGTTGFDFDTSAGTMSARLVNPDELRISAVSHPHFYRWTRRGSKDSFAVPDTRHCERSIWEHDSGGKVLLLKSKKAVSITLMDDLGVTSYRSRWVAKPLIFEFGARGGKMETVTLLSGNRLNIYKTKMYTLVQPDGSKPRQPQATGNGSPPPSQPAPSTQVELPSKELDFSEIGDY